MTGKAEAIENSEFFEKNDIFGNFIYMMCIECKKDKVFENNSIYGLTFQFAGDTLKWKSSVWEA